MIIEWLKRKIKHSREKRIKALKIEYSEINGALGTLGLSKEVAMKLIRRNEKIKKTLETLQKKV